VLGWHIVFFEPKICLLIEPPLDNWFQNLIAINLEWQLAILIARYLIKGKITLEVVANCTPDMQSFPFSFIIPI
jgi:hypothetical protein